MKPKSIIMKAHDVQALLRGDKTQFRLPVKPQPHETTEVNTWGFSALTPPGFIEMRGYFNAHSSPDNDSGFFSPRSSKRYGSKFWKMPYQPGQILYMRETWFSTRFDYKDQLEYGNRSSIRYAADGNYCPRRDCVGRHWFSPSQMPTSAARIWLQVESVRVERLQDISEDDAKAEGVERVRAKVDDFGNVVAGTEVYRNYPHPLISALMDPRDSFSTLWQSIHGAESWDANPWVFAVTFKLLSTTGKPDNLKSE